MTSGFPTLTFPLKPPPTTHTHLYLTLGLENCCRLSFLTSAITFLNRSNIWYYNRSVVSKEKKKGLTCSWRKVWCYSTSLFFFSVYDQALTGKDLEDLLHPVTCTESVPGLVCRLAEKLKPSQVSIQRFLKFQYQDISFWTEDSCEKDEKIFIFCRNLTQILV